MKISRVLLTLDCNFNCTYCCNKKFPELLSTFKNISVADLLNTDFDAYNLSGGEPLLNSFLTLNLANHFSKRGKSVRIYTNGVYLDEQLFNAFHSGGLNRFEIGIHKNEQLPEIVLQLIEKHPEMFRISINKNQVDNFKFGGKIATDLPCEVNQWAMDECENDDTARFILE